MEKIANGESGLRQLRKGAAVGNVEASILRTGLREALSRRDGMIVAWQFTAWNVFKQGNVPSGTV